MKVTKHPEPRHRPPIFDNPAGTEFVWEGMFNDLKSCMPKYGEVFCPNGLTGKRYIVKGWAIRLKSTISKSLDTSNGDSIARIECAPCRPAKLTPGCLKVDTSKFDKAVARCSAALKRAADAAEMSRATRGRNQRRPGYSLRWRRDKAQSQ